MKEMKYAVIIASAWCGVTTINAIFDNYCEAIKYVVDWIDSNTAISPDLKRKYLKEFDSSEFTEVQELICIGEIEEGVI